MTQGRAGGLFQLPLRCSEHKGRHKELERELKNIRANERTRKVEYFHGRTSFAERA